jgi:hypothetical protein
MSEVKQGSVGLFQRVSFRLPGKLKRIGCVLGLMIWFSLLLFPCLVIVLLTRDEIDIQLGDIPGQSLRIWLVNGARERGLAISVPTVQTNSEGNMACLETRVNFVLWMGEGKPTQYCECYSRLGDNWIASSNSSQICKP